MKSDHDDDDVDDNDVDDDDGDHDDAFFSVFELKHWRSSSGDRNKIT